METLEVPKDHYLVKSFTVYGKVAHIRWKSSEELAALISALLEVNPTYEVVAITTPEEGRTILIFRKKTAWPLQKVNGKPKVFLKVLITEWVVRIFYYFLLQ